MQQSGEIKKALRDIQKEFRKDITNLEEKYDDQIKSLYDSVSTYDDIIKGSRGGFSLDAAPGTSRNPISFKDVLEPIKKEFENSINIVRKLASEKEEDFYEDEMEEIEEAKKKIEKKADNIRESEMLIERVDISQPSEPERKRKTIDDLFELVVKNKEIEKREASKALGVHEIQVEEWANVLKKHGLIRLEREAGTIWMVKKK